MKPLPADRRKDYRYVVTAADTATFHGETVHEVCSTFVLAREIEWTTRQFMGSLCDHDEEGVGTQLTIEHKSPAFVGEAIIFTADIEALNGNELICTYQARVADRLIATGKTGQKILKKDKISRIFDPQKPQGKPS